MSQPTTTPAREIVYDPETRDFALYLDGELVNFARSYADGEQALDTILAERGRRGRLAAARAAMHETANAPFSTPEELDAVTQAALAAHDEFLAARAEVEAERLLAPQAIEDQGGRRYTLVEQRPDGSALYRAPRARATLYMSDYAVRLMNEGMGVTIEELVDPRTGRTRLFSYRAA